MSPTAKPRKANTAHDAPEHASWHVGANDTAAPRRERARVYHYIAHFPIVPAYTAYRVDSRNPRDIITSRDLSVRLRDVEGIYRQKSLGLTDIS